MKPCELFYENIEVHLLDKHPKGNVQPDLKVVCHPEQLQSNAIVGASTFVVEILAPSTSSRDQIIKRRLYESHGVPEYWIVSPGEQTITILRLVDGAYEEEFLDEVYASGSIARGAVLPGFEIALAKLFQGLQGEEQDRRDCNSGSRIGNECTHRTA